MMLRRVRLQKRGDEPQAILDPVRVSTALQPISADRESQGGQKVIIKIIGLPVCRCESFAVSST